MPHPLHNRIVSAAGTVEQFDAEVADWMRRESVGEDPPDRDILRKAILRRAWRKHLSGLPRSGAARELADLWATIDGSEEHIPGSLEEMVARLVRARFRPLSSRRIDDLLDPQFDA